MLPRDQTLMGMPHCGNDRQKIHVKLCRATIPASSCLHQHGSRSPRGPRGCPCGLPRCDGASGLGKSTKPGSHSALWNTEAVAMMPAARAAQALVVLGTKKLDYVIPRRKTSARKDHFGAKQGLTLKFEMLQSRHIQRKNLDASPICIYSFTNCWAFTMIVWFGSFLPQRNSLKIWNVYNPLVFYYVACRKGSQSSQIETKNYLFTLCIFPWALSRAIIRYAVSLHDDFFRISFNNEFF